MLYNINTKTITVGLENTSRNNRAIDILKDTFNPLFKDIFHVKCCWYILNLMLKDAKNYFRNHIEKISYAIAFIFSGTD